MKKHEQGSILVFTVMTVAVLMIVGVSFLSLASAEYLANVSHSHRIQAFYEAEGGLAYARQYVYANYQTIATSFDADGRYVVPGVPVVDQPQAPHAVITRVSPTQWLLESTGFYRRARQNVFRDVNFQAPDSSGGGGSVIVVPPQPADAEPLPAYEEIQMTAALGDPLRNLVTDGASYEVNAANTPAYLGNVGLLDDKEGSHKVRVTASAGDEDVVLYIWRLDLRSSNSEFIIEGNTTVRLIIVDYFDYNSGSRINANGLQAQLHIYPYNSSTNLNGNTVSVNNNNQKFNIYPGVFIGSLPAIPGEPPDFGDWSGN